MSKIILYTTPAKLSPPGRAVELTLNALGLEFEHKFINLIAGEHLTQEFLKLNPQHTVPVLDDNGTVIWESHAICMYLVQKYGKDDKLYPNDLLARTRVNAVLHFDSTVLFARLRFLLEPVFYHGIKEMAEEKVEYIKKAYKLVEDTLQSDFLVGNNVTIADFCCISNIATMSGIFPITQAELPKTCAWMERLGKLPYYNSANKQGADDLAGHFMNAIKN